MAKKRVTKQNGSGKGKASSSRKKVSAGFGGGPTIGLASGTTINFTTSSPFTAQTTITGKFDANTVMMGYQVNTNAPVGISSPNGALDFSTTTWSLVLTTMDCPTPGATYTLVVFEWTGTGSTQSTPVSFQRGT